MPLFHEFDTIGALREALRKGEISASEVAGQALARIESQAHLNAFLHVDPELTLQQARRADAAMGPEGGGALAGVPIAHKDLYVTRGWRSTAASRMLADYASPFDATVVSRLEKEGAVSLGKLNCDEFGMGSRNDYSAFGPARNPWDAQRSPGGSSGGSAAAVAAGLVMAATGTDTGGSIRQPAALCGVSGIKPTYGTVSRHGMIAYASSLDQAGVMARHAADLLELLDPMSGFDPLDANCLQDCGGRPNAPGRMRADFERHGHTFRQQDSRPLQGLRIGIPTEFFDARLDAEIAAATEAALGVFSDMGAERVEISLPRTELSIPAYYVISPAEASSNLARYDAVRYGHRTADYGNLEEMTSRSRAESLGEEVIRRIMVGTFVLSHGYYDAYYVQAQKVRRMIADDYRHAFTQCDVIMGPVTPSLPAPVEGGTDDPVAQWLGDVYTLGVSLSGLPAMSVPCGFSKGARPLPIGLQIIGNYFNEGQLLAVADCFQQATDWHLRKPELPK